ncbi:hypothetical protein OA92_06915 [Marinomonas sp. SBI22]|uniref:crotonase/enoyl-CoA hydratase family protein n=1 Tax=unclassified Marinomonas TaxID=196814 RepID=UPI0007AF1A2E|nr:MULTISPECIES: crotonase/enoyl-CoA hydratase family protein [unclassified Marinomonas]KZM44386.1 hypothetical protein OA92_06915 [Marinomonas sp. SBI22]KZM45544.1 hypothetical protein OA91_08060 [Marinomonas sp. SBI8L]
MSDRITIEITNHIAQVRLNRADKLNAVDMNMIYGLIEAAAKIKQQKNIRAVVIAGNGPSFCSGLDIPSIMAQPDNIPKLLTTEEDYDANLAQRCALDWHDLNIPVIAALQGHVYGAGLQIAMAADIRIAQKDTLMSIMEIKWGLIPDMSLTATTPHFARQDVIKELTFTGKKFNAEEGLAYGLVTRLDEDPITGATELAQQIVNKNPDAIQGAKTLLNQAWQQERQASLALEEKIQRTIIGSKNQMEAVQANFAKRQANFEDNK